MENIQWALELQDVNKTFGSFKAVDHLTLRIGTGQIYALLGPNGAGKTTTLRMIAGLLIPDGGEIQILGQSVISNPQAAKRPLAYLPDEPLLYGKLRPMEYLEFVAGLWGMNATEAYQEAQELLKWLDLWEHRSAFAESYSRGMKQKLALAGALIHKPQVMILDEPLTGLDAAAARQVKDLLSQFVKDGNTVVLTTHILEVAERMSERIAIINKGQIIAEGSLQELRLQSGEAQGTLEDVFLELVGAGS
ncbi:ABC transporter ATP-binding protein [Deinococcus cellulosilyticus]|uniref:ABC transporter ATP-binding protein n=1 Tax=Deinococcus cellulosilyticus (strain DSM 18568 / NBRC 106333 / KACC 11606 / 5516J-15) TaxID=1223518 RepID=A0A511NB74_DEIC1|nr:ABC transporter ATP-binding protein [Deinococcus cellulosilyticus]GEM50079.1 ABC transporter ATP-binding protein [Deinococcus cellulosilyticus NBRC 106333 = KACC 11606]